jgi:hypothetical protein
MPTLADIYSAINTAKRKGADFVQNPGTSLQQMVGNANDQARGFNQLNDQALAEMQQTNRLTGPAGQQLMQKVGQAFEPVGMTVWHGSPHIFERFDPTKIGTGEGAQMYGKGLYTAQQQEVAKRFTPRDMNYEDQLMKKYQQAEKSGDYTSMQVYEDFLTQKTPEEIASSFKDMGFVGKDLIKAQRAFDDAKKLYQRQKQGSLYKVDLPDTHIRRMLDYDAPLKDQPYNVRNFAKKLGVDMNDLGGDLLMKVGKSEEGKKALQDAGIPGIKYFDQMARGDQKNARNFVVFDPEHLTVLERNAKPIK